MKKELDTKLYIQIRNLSREMIGVWEEMTGGRRAEGNLRYQFCSLAMVKIILMGFRLTKNGKVEGEYADYDAALFSKTSRSSKI